MQPDMSQLLQQAQAMQQQLAAAQERLAETLVTGSAGGGMVSATVTGTGDLVSVTIDPSVLDPAEVEMLQDLVVAAVRDANTEAATLAAQAMGPLAGGLGGLGLPGM